MVCDLSDSGFAKHNRFLLKYEDTFAFTVNNGFSYNS